MCGITGQFVFNRSKTAGGASERLIRALMEMMQTRGPDDQGFWTDRESCWLGFRRLSILDLSPSGHQPMHTSDNRYSLVFNGELYNYRELRQELESKGIRFRSTGDSEVVLYALAQWGIEAFDRFNGMFALAFYDRAKKRLLLGRDHAGIKPLYYLLTQDGLVFGSQYDQVLCHPWSENLRISKGALALYTTLGFIPAPFAALENTFMLEAGGWLEVTADAQVRQGRFFAFPRNNEADLVGQDALEAVEEVITRAVRRQLASDVPVGVFLSGGIDSPLVAAEAAQAYAGSMQAFTIGTGGDEHDESLDSKHYAENFGLEHTLRQFSPDEVVGYLDDITQAASEPLADFSLFPTWLVSQVAHEKVKVVLSGDGGDELFWGYVPRMAPVIREAGVFGKPVWQRKLGLRLRQTLRLGRGKGVHLLPSVGDWYLEKHNHLHHYFGIVFPGLSLPDEFTAFNFAGHERSETAQWLRWNEFMVHLTGVLLKVDRASMANSLEVRVPLLDREVIEVASRVDWRTCLDLRKNLGKLPLRYALAKHTEYQTAAKRGFTIPMNRWLRGPLRQLFEERVLAADELVGLPVNKQALHSLWRAHVSGGKNFQNDLWLLLSLALWEDRHLKNRQQKLEQVMSAVEVRA